MRFYKLIILLLLLISPAFLHAQFFSWTHGGGASANDNLTSVSSNQNGSIYFCGNSEFASDFVFFQNDSFQIVGGQDAFIAKTSRAGDEKFFISIGSSDFESANAIQSDQSGNLFIGGGIEGATFFGANQSTNTGKSFYLASFDTLGGNNWVFTTDSTFSNSQAEITSITESGSNVIAGGFFYDSLKIGSNIISSNISGVKTPMVISLTKSGNLNWIKIFQVGNSSNLNAIASDAGGNIYVGGNFRNTLQIDAQILNSAGKTDLYLTKLNGLTGNLLWAKRAGNTEHETINTISVKGNKLVYGGFFNLGLNLDGFSISSSLSVSAFYAMANLNGSTQVLQKIGGATTDEVLTLGISDDFKVAVAGYVGENPIIKGKSYVNFKQTGFILLVDTNNNLIKRRVFDVNSNQEVTSVSFIDNDEIAVGGNFIGTTAFEPYGALMTNGKKDFFITKMRDCVGNVPAPISYATNDTLCKGDSVIFASSNANNKTYKWLRNNAVLTGETNTSLKVGISGNYKVIVNFDGCEDTSKALRASFLPQPTVSIDAFPTTCDNQDSIILTQGKPAGGVYSGIGVNNGKFDPKVTSSGAVPITYTFVNSFGCVDSSVRNLFVGAKPNVNFPNLSALCSFDTLLKLSNAIPKGGIYSGIGVVNNTFNSAIGFGLHNLAYTYTNGSGCSSTDSATIFVDSLPYISLENIGRVCIFNGTVTLENGFPLGGIYTGPAITGNQFDPTQTGLGTFFHTYTVTAPSGCTNSRTATIKVEDAPKPILPDSAFLCYRNQLELTTIDTIYPFYFWGKGGDLPTGVFGPGELELGGQFLKVVVTDDLGCQGTDSTFVLVDYCQTLSVYPNPSTGSLNVSFNTLESGEARLWLISASGQKMIDKTISYNVGENIYYYEDFSAYSGVYTLVILFDDHYLHQQISLINQF